MREAPFNLVIHWHRENIVAKQFLQPHIRNVRNVDGIYEDSGGVWCAGCESIHGGA